MNIYCFLGPKARSSVFATVACIFGIVIGLGGPAEFEARLFPITSPTKGIITENTPKKVCWEIRFTKLRNASPRYFAWILETPDGKRHYIAPYRPDGVSHSANTTSKKGQDGVYPNCAVKPRGVGDNFRIEAHAEYHVFHGLWTVPRHIPPFNSLSGSQG